MQSEPATMQLSGDGTLTLTHIVWQHWGNSEATGTGQYAIRSCTPTCASGTTTDQPGQVLLTRLVAYNGGMAYDDITLVTPAGVQPATGDHIAGTVP